MRRTRVRDQYIHLYYFSTEIVPFIHIRKRKIRATLVTGSVHLDVFQIEFQILSSFW